MPASDGADSKPMILRYARAAFLIIAPVQSDAEKRSMKTVVGAVRGEGGGREIYPDGRARSVRQKKIKIGRFTRIEIRTKYPRLSVESIGNKTNSVRITILPLLMSHAVIIKKGILTVAFAINITGVMRSATGRCVEYGRIRFQ